MGETLLPEELGILNKGSGTSGFTAVGEHVGAAAAEDLIAAAAVNVEAST